MLTLQIENQKIEHFVDRYYGEDTQSLWRDFVAFIHVSLKDGYPTISPEEARARVEQALREIDDGQAEMLTAERYEQEMAQFMDRL